MLRNRLKIFVIISVIGLVGAFYYLRAQESAIAAQIAANIPSIKIAAAPIATSAKDSQPDQPDIKSEKKPAPPMSPKMFAEYKAAIDKISNMVAMPAAQNLAAQLGLNILNLTWEDTGRYKNSAVGPNISDMTIQVGARNPQTQKFAVSCMPVIRYPNYEDKTADLDPRDFTLLVGNQANRQLQRVSLYDFLDNPIAYLSNPQSWQGSQPKTLLAPRDTKVLVSAQACFLPVPKAGSANFNPVIFNYQSYPGNPAVLTVLATREGTSVTVIDNKRDAFETGAVWGQRLFHNDNGMRASLTGERESDFLFNNNDNHQTPQIGSDNSNNSTAGLNMVLLIQIPLKHKENYSSDESVDKELGMMPNEPAPPPAAAKSDVENAVIGHGDLEGPFTEIDNLAIERDDRYPIRVTVQFYKATANGIVNENDLREIKDQIDRVYAHSDYVGSLVTEGKTNRVTEYAGIKVQPADWWEKFWQRREQATGESRAIAIEKLRKLLGANYPSYPVSDLYLRNLLK